MRAALALPFLLAACLQPPTARSTGSVLLVTDPPGATVTFRDGTSCETPCRVAVPGLVSMTVARAGYEAIRTELTPQSPPEIRFALTPVGRTGTVEEVELPPL
jgi:hypothetical protein